MSKFVARRLLVSLTITATVLGPIAQPAFADNSDDAQCTQTCAAFANGTAGTLSASNAGQLSSLCAAFNATSPVNDLEYAMIALDTAAAGVCAAECISGSASMVTGKVSACNVAGCAAGLAEVSDSIYMMATSQTSLVPGMMQTVMGGVGAVMGCKNFFTKNELKKKYGTDDAVLAFVMLMGPQFKLAMLGMDWASSRAHAGGTTVAPVTVTGTAPAAGATQTSYVMPNGNTVVTTHGAPGSSAGEGTTTTLDSTGTPVGQSNYGIGGTNNAISYQYNPSTNTTTVTTTQNGVETQASFPGNTVPAPPGAPTQTTVDTSTGSESQTTALPSGGGNAATSTVDTDAQGTVTGTTFTTSSGATVQVQQMPDGSTAGVTTNGNGTVIGGGVTDADGNTTYTSAAPGTAPVTSTTNAQGDVTSMEIGANPPGSGAGGGSSTNSTAGSVGGAGGAGSFLNSSRFGACVSMTMFSFTAGLRIYDIVHNTESRNSSCSSIIQLVGNAPSVAASATPTTMADVTSPSNPAPAEPAPAVAPGTVAPKSVTTSLGSVTTTGDGSGTTGTVSVAGGSDGAATAGGTSHVVGSGPQGQAATMSMAELSCSTGSKCASTVDGSALANSGLNAAVGDTARQFYNNAGLRSAVMSQGSIAPLLSKLSAAGLGEQELGNILSLSRVAKNEAPLYAGILTGTKGSTPTTVNRQLASIHPVAPGAVAAGARVGGASQQINRSNDGFYGRRGDIWHSGTDMNLFQIVSSRLNLDSLRVISK